MAHVRQQIRDAVVAVLKGGTSAADDVFPTRVHSLPEKKLRALTVFTTDERSEVVRNDDECGKLYRRTVTVNVDLYTKGDHADDYGDDLAAEVEARMERDPTFAGLVRELVLGASTDVFTGEGERIVGRKRLAYAATYLAKATDPTTV